MNYNKFLQIFSLITLGVLFGLMFMGGYVSSSGVGLSCPKWPLCPHGLIPSPEFLIEYTHRTIAASTGLLVLLNMVFILKGKDVLKSTKLFSIIATCAVFGQIFLGGIVITEKLHALLVTAHLGLGLILYSSLIYVVINTFYTNTRIRLSSAYPSTLSSTSSSKTNSSSQAKFPRDKFKL
jgi:cytochrome c oxidase assembly protein subunit 15